MSSCSFLSISLSTTTDDEDNDEDKMTTTTSELLLQAEKLTLTNPQEAESVYKQILSTTTCPSPSLPFFFSRDKHERLAISNDDPEDQSRHLRDQETALVKLGELYRDQKCALFLVLILGRRLMRGKEMHRA